jgi:hypothetical protein
MVSIIEGIVDPRSSDMGVGVLNSSEDVVVLEAGSDLGCCRSSYEEVTFEAYHHTNLVNCKEPTAEVNLPDHLNELVERSSTHLSADEKQQLACLLSKYASIFVASSDDLGCTNLVKHTINTGNAIPIRQAPRRQPFGKRQCETEEIERMLSKGIIEPSNSAWSSPIVLVTKKDGSTRFCVDYRKLNEVTVKDAYPIPRVDDCLDALSGAKWFNCMDLCSGFWQIEMDKNDKLKTAFSTSSGGLHHFKVMPFGLVNAPSTFQRLMENVLRGLQWVESLLYMDDIITPGRSVDECLLRLEHVFDRIQKANLKLKSTKCLFFQKSVTFLGHNVSEDGIRTDSNKIEAVQNWPIPVNAKEVRSFLGLASYYRRFVKCFAEIARPLHKICEKHAKFKWDADCQIAFDTLKGLLTTAPVLAYPRMDCKFILDTDASDKAIGAILSQEQDGKDHVIAYMSKAMNKHEQAYCVTRKELLAVIVALKQFHHYLYGQEVLLRTDNAAVSWMKSLKVPTGQVARWLQELGTYNLTVIHRAGKSHNNADALSRKPCKVCARQQELSLANDDNNNGDQDVQKVRVTTRKGASQAINNELSENHLLLDGWNATEIANEQLSDPEIGPLLSAKLAGVSRPNWSAISHGKAALKSLWRQWDRLEIKGGMMYRLFVTPSGNVIYQLVVPSKKRKEVMYHHHDVPTAGHLGVNKTLEKIRNGFYWPGMSITAKQYCQKCDTCTVRNLSKENNKAPLGNYIVGEPMERVMMDILGPLPTTKSGNKYILVISDWFTKWSESIAIPDQEAKTIAEAFVCNFVTRFGVPLQLYTDQGRNFESKLLLEVCQLLNIEKTHSTSMRPQANGMVERMNRTILSMLSKYCQANQYNWDRFLPLVMMAYRSSNQSSTKVSPNKMVFGREIVLPINAVIGRPSVTDQQVSSEEYVQILKQKLEEAHEVARVNIGNVSQYQKRHYDTNAKKRTFVEGQCVWLHDPTRKKGVCSKLLNKWKGPFLVTRVLDDLICLVKQSKNQKPKAYHVDRLWHYTGSNIPTWIKREKTGL